IDGTPLSVLCIGVGGAPFEGRGAIAGSEKVVTADIYGNRTQCGQLAEQLPAVAHIGVVGFVIAKIGPKSRKRMRLIGVVDGDRLLRESDSSASHRHQAKQQEFYFS